MGISRKQWIENGRFYKEADDAAWQYLQMCKWDFEVRPHDMSLYDERLSYTYLPGAHAQDWRVVYNLAMRHVWKGVSTEVTTAEKIAYMDYCVEIAPNMYKDDLRRMLNMHLTAPLNKPRHMVHGDLTLYNVIVGADRVQFFDPAPPRLNCVEIDISKILQSLDGFGVVYRGEPQPMSYPRMPTSPVVWALLVTHYVRLLRHVKHDAALRFTHQRIQELLCVLIPISSTSTGALSCTYTKVQLTNGTQPK